MIRTATIAAAILLSAWAGCFGAPDYQLPYAGDPRALTPYAEAVALQWDCGAGGCRIEGEIWAHNPTHQTQIADVSCSLYNGAFLIGDAPAVKSNVVIEPCSSRRFTTIRNTGEPERIAFSMECEITALTTGE